EPVLELPPGQVAKRKTPAHAAPPVSPSVPSVATPSRRHKPGAGRRSFRMAKGIVHPEDAARAADSGIDGPVVSNHGEAGLADIRSAGQTCCSTASPSKVL